MCFKDLQRPAEEAASGYYGVTIRTMELNVTPTEEDGTKLQRVENLDSGWVEGGKM
jgi:hypothetical protein